MDDPVHLIPKHKSDFDAIRSIERAGYPAIAPILDELIEWTADGNWPIAQPLADILASIGRPMVRSISNILRGADSVHKYFCFILIISKLPADVVLLLKDELDQLANNPSTADKNEEVDELARSTLRRLKAET